jgi:hypothetical protein
MFSTLRIAAVIGVIYYLSPVRNEDALAGIGHVAAWGKGLVVPTREATREATATERLETLWKALPEDAKQAALDRVLAEAGRHVTGSTEPARAEPVKPEPAPAPAPPVPPAAPRKTKPPVTP